MCRRAAGETLDGLCSNGRLAGQLLQHALAAEALHILEQRKITSIVVVDSSQKVEGVVHLHDLWGTEMI